LQEEAYREGRPAEEDKKDEKPQTKAGGLVQRRVTMEPETQNARSNKQSVQGDQ
jgi:hypothetical protein